MQREEGLSCPPPSTRVTDPMDVDVVSPLSSEGNESRRNTSDTRENVHFTWLAS